MPEKSKKPESPADKQKACEAEHHYGGRDATPDSDVNPAEARQADDGESQKKSAPNGGKAWPQRTA